MARIKLILMLMALSFASSACSARHAAPESTTGLPPFPVDRKASSITTTRLGIEYSSRSPNAIDVGEDLRLQYPGEDKVAWGIYQFTPTATVATLKVTVESPGVWLAIADFTQGKWVVNGQITSGENQLSLDPANTVSPNGNVYVAVIATGNEVANIKYLTLTEREPPVAALAITPRTGVPGEPITLDASGSLATDGYFVRYEWDLDGDGTFELDSGADPIVEGTLPAPAGRKTLSVSVTDDGGLTNQASDVVGSIDAVKLTDSCFGFSGIQVVDGNPAVAYAVPFDRIEYRRALDQFGNAWSDPITVATGSIRGEGTTFTLINDLPAVAYTSLSAKSIKYCAALDTHGAQWSSPVTVVEETSDYHINLNWRGALLEVNGRPAVAYYQRYEPPFPSEPEVSLQYVRASNPEGSSWQSPIPIDEECEPVKINLIVVDGKPAAFYDSEAYYDQLGPEGIMFTRSLDEDGDTWGNRLKLSDGRWLCASLVNGNPAVLFGTQQGATYIRALDQTGSLWGSPVPISGASGIGILSMQYVNGIPWMGFSNNYSIGTAQATDPDGSSWQSLDTLENTAFDIDDIEMVDSELIGLPGATGLVFGYEFSHIPPLYYKVLSP